MLANSICCNFKCRDVYNAKIFFVSCLFFCCPKKSPEEMWWFGRIVIKSLSQDFGVWNSMRYRFIFMIFNFFCKLNFDGHLINNYVPVFCAVLKPQRSMQCISFFYDKALNCQSHITIFINYILLMSAIWRNCISCWTKFPCLIVVIRDLKISSGPGNSYVLMIK